MKDLRYTLCVSSLLSPAAHVSRSRPWKEGSGFFLRLQLLGHPRDRARWPEPLASVAILAGPYMVDRHQTPGPQGAVSGTAQDAQWNEWWAH